MHLGCAPAGPAGNEKLTKINYILINKTIKELEKLKLQKIWQKLWLFFAWLQTVVKELIIKRWAPIYLACHKLVNILYI